MLGGRYTLIGDHPCGFAGQAVLVRPRVGPVCVMHRLDWHYTDPNARLIRRAPYDLPRHRNLVLVLDSRVDLVDSGIGGLDWPHDSGFIVHEFVHGEMLPVAVRRHGMPPLPIACGIVADAARAVAVLHARGRPAYLTGGKQVLVQADGVTKLEILTSDPMRPTPDPTGPNEDFTVASIEYYEPAVLRGERGWILQSDIFALGVMLWELTIGQRFEAGRFSTLTWLEYALEWSPPAMLPGSVPHDFGRFLLSMLDADPSRRPSLADIIEELGRIARTHPTKTTFATWVAAHPGKWSLPPRHTHDLSDDDLAANAQTLRPIHPIEHEFLTLLGGLRGDIGRDESRAVREVYGDWLEERGEFFKAEYLRLILTKMKLGSMHEAVRHALEIDLDPFWCRTVRADVCLLEDDAGDSDEVDDTAPTIRAMPASSTSGAPPPTPPEKASVVPLRSTTSSR